MFGWNHLLGNWRLIWGGLDCWEIAATHIRLQGGLFDINIPLVKNHFKMLSRDWPQEVAWKQERGKCEREQWQSRAVTAP